MKKLLIILSIFLLSGCNFNKEQLDEDIIKYNAIENSIIENSEFKYASQYYDIEIEMTKIDETTYRYYLTLLNPKTAMYDVIFASKDVKDFNTDEIMMPTVGIFEDTKFNLVPNQYNEDKGYVKGLVLSGEKIVSEGETPNINLRLYVKWDNQDRSIETKEYLLIEYTYSDTTQHEELSEEEKATQNEENNEEGSDESDE